MTTTEKRKFDIYRLIKEEHEEGTNKRTSYGIAVYGDENAPERVTETIHDITGDESELSLFISILNREKLSPIHIREVTDDRFDEVK